jgi:TatD DNase family protein
MPDCNISLFDTHTHLNVEAYDTDRPAVLERACLNGVQEMLVVGFDLESSRAAAALAGEAGLYAAVGIQPHYAGETGRQELDQLRRLAKLPGVVALGEMGLDYYRNRASHPEQQLLFREQLEMAGELGLPVVIHSREAADDLLAILRETGRGVRGVMHCYSGSLEQAHAFLALGLYISIAGPVTYPKAAKTWQVATEVPLDRLLIETDCPWLAPQCHRGQRNEPAYVREVATRIAELRGLSLEQVAQATVQNAHDLFTGTPLLP